MSATAATAGAPAGEARPDARTPGRPAADRRGYTLAAVAVGITVMLVLVAAMLPLASTEAQRDKESELIFRGLQYAEGIRVFRRRFGRYPNTLKELLEVKPRSVRKLWKDPMTNSDAWGLVRVGDPGAAIGGGRVGGGEPGTLPTPTPAPTKPPGFGGGGPPGSDSPLPIAGVYSKSGKTGYRTWEGRDVYSDWKFTEASLALGPDGASTGVPGPGGGFPTPKPGGSGGSRR